MRCGANVVIIASWWTVGGWTEQINRHGSWEDGWIDGGRDGGMVHAWMDGLMDIWIERE